MERAAYLAQQLTLLVNGILLDRTARALARLPREPVSRRVLEELRDRFRALLERDLANVEAGHYPRELLFQIPLSDYARALPALLSDVPRTVRRIRDNNYKDLPASVSLDRYPPYYRRNFHWQTDGYLSEHSAEVYDVGVEILFLGTADIMRRQIIPPISRFLAHGDPRSTKLLDIGCGTGRTLKQLATAHPELRYHGVDLSPFYVQAARKLLAPVREVSLLCENAEALPYVDGYFDVATSIYLFHELPRNARRRVLDEAYRVLRPGGLLVVEDSVQPSDSEILIDVLAAFPRTFHEPFYECYLDDDLGKLLAERGFEVEACEPHMVAKVVVARKPEN